MTKSKINKIYYLGPNGTYTYKALEIFLKDNNIGVVEKKPMKNIKSIIAEVDCDKTALGVVPCENSIEGIVRETMDSLIMLQDKDVKIIAEIILPINHCLMSVSDDKSTIKTVVSHPQALAQCRKYLDKSFKDIHLLEEPSTSAAAARIKTLQDTSYAAIANEIAAEIFDLNVLDCSINDEKDNKTRFVVLGRENPPQTSDDKTSLVFSTKNIPGALAKVLNVFDKYNINLSYIDSRPSKKNLGEYNFYIDTEGHIKDGNMVKAMKEIEPLINFYRYNGSYKKYRSV